MRFGSPAVACVLLCAVAALSFPLPDRIEERDGAGLRIVTDPSDADLFIDGIRKGKTPISVTDLSPGAHRLELFKDGYRKREEMILIREDALLSIYMELKTTRGKVSVTVRPAQESPGNPLESFNPFIIVDGARKEVGTIELAEGLHSFKARAFGWEDQTRSVLVRGDEVIALDMVLAPAEFKLSNLSARRKRFNPLDSGKLGSSSITFQVTAPGSARLSVLSKDGVELFSKELGPFVTWDQEFAWDGRNAEGIPLEDGEYAVLVRSVSAPRPAKQSAIEVARTAIALDSTVGLRPAAMSSAVAGALYAPQARFLPPGAFQLEGSLLLGDAYDGAIGEAPPVAFGLRLVPAEGWEIGAAADIVSAASDEAGAVFAVSARRSLTQARRSRPFSAALSLRYGWESAAVPAPYGLSGGLEIDVPLELGEAGDRSLFIGASPGLLWSGNLPDEALPRLVLAAAAGRRAERYCAAVSARTEGDLSGGGGAWPLRVAAEGRFFPPPSTLVYGLVAGARMEDGDVGFFGGINFGFLF